MYNLIFGSILETNLTAKSFIICSFTSLILGFLLSFTQMYKSRSTKSFAVTVALLPLIVQVIIMLVNGNLGTGIAVAGAFSLVRFRSVPGSAKEILSIFMAMAVGLATGVGFVGISVIFTFLLIATNFIYSYFNFGDNAKCSRELKITIPENMNYTEAFSDILKNLQQKIISKRLKQQTWVHFISWHILLNLKMPKKKKNLLIN